ncbi:hypothetical protein EIP86_008708 [Pleurotus ostreatoroseus]|nr:hypothetical protein EIP86_008708 [Pleurotus ostreatoroseus]
MLGGTTLLDRDWEDISPPPVLSALPNEARQLGSSVGILSASFRLCERLARILHLFRQNAHALFPKLKLRAKGLELNVDRRWNFKRQRRRRHTDNRFLSLVTRLSTTREEPKAKELPAELVLFAKDIAMLLDCFSQFPDFLEEVPEQSLETDLKFWAECMRKFEDDIETPAVRRYIHDVSVCLGPRLQHIKDFIPVFIGVGVKTIRGAQKHSAANLINLSTVATLFSGVTATMVQFSYADTATATANAVNGFWFTSLVFSISAAVNSLLGLTWMQAAFRSPDHRVPWWVMIWIKRSPLVFMVFSVACFFIGLVSFVYASGQNTVTCIVTTVLSISCCFGLTALSLWFAFERWIYDWHDGYKLLSDVLSDAGQDVLEARPVAWSGAQIYRGMRLVHTLLAFLGSIPQSVARATGTQSSASDTSTVVEDPEALIEATERAVPLGTFNTVEVDHDKPLQELRGKARFIALVERIIIMQRAIPHRPPPRPTGLRSSKRQITSSSDLGSAIPSSRIGALLPKLQNFQVTKQIDAHNALVRNIQFSPDGLLLATSRIYHCPLFLCPTPRVSSAK